jgi:hypothetical protein
MYHFLRTVYPMYCWFWTMHCCEYSCSETFPDSINNTIIVFITVPFLLQGLKVHFVVSFPLKMLLHANGRSF